jgi:hypothetical protein
VNYPLNSQKPIFAKYRKREFFFFGKIKMKILLSFREIGRIMGVWREKISTGSFHSMRTSITLKESPEYMPDSNIITIAQFPLIFCHVNYLKDN